MSPSPGLKRFGAVSFFYFAAIGLFNPYAPLWFQSLGFSTLVIGAIASLQSWTRVLAPYAWSWAGDHGGRRVELIRLAALGSLLAALGLLVIGSGEGSGRQDLVVAVAVMTTLIFVANSGVVPLYEAVLAHVLATPDGGIDARRYGRVRVWGSIGFIVAVTSFGLLLEQFGIRVFPWFVGAMNGLLLLAAMRLPATRAEAVHDEPAPPVLPLLKKPEVAWFFASIFFTVLAHTSLYAFFSLYLVELGYGKGAVGMLWAVSVVVEIDGLLKSQSVSLARLDELLAVRITGLEQRRNAVAVVLVIAGLAVLYLFMSFRKVLEGGLREVEFHINAMRDGDLTTHPRAWGGDEAARLMLTLAAMQASLRRIVSQVRGASDSIVSASTQIAGGANDLSSRTEQSAANLEETASAMEEIAATVKRGEDAVGEASRLAVANAEQAEQGGRIVGELVQTMQAINGSSVRIGDIIGTIDGIAFQTNILALNAAVEAARAGEQGRGFAVVASEVRALAQRSATAAREIKSLVGTSLEQTESGVHVVKKAGDQIQAIVDSARRVNELLAEVSVGAREQTAGVMQSAKAVQELDSVTQQNAALVEQTAAAAGSLQDQAHGLAGEVSQFRLPATH